MTPFPQYTLAVRKFRYASEALFGIETGNSIKTIATDNVPALAAGTVGVEFLGEYYFIRSLAAKPDRSMQALSLVSLLIGLQKKASDLPTSSSVRVIGQ